MAKKKQPVVDQEAVVQAYLDKWLISHEITTLRNADVDRHFVCKNPANSAYWFGVITWRGYLCIYGDIGTYVLARVPDMLPFVANSAPGYLLEKVESFDRIGGTKQKRGQLCPDRFMMCVLAVRWLWKKLEATNA